MFAQALALLLGHACEPVCISGTQELSGFKYFNAGFCSMEDAYFNKKILAYPGKQLALIGDRNDSVAAVFIGNTVKRDGGASLFEVGNGPNHADQTLVGTAVGDLVLSCSDAAQTGGCSLVDGTGVSGHITVTTHGGLYTTIQGQLDDPGVPAKLGHGWDAGVLYEARYAGLHGDVTTHSKFPRIGGFRLQVKGAGDDRWFYVDHAYGIGTRHQVPFSQFPGPAVKINVDLGEFWYGQLESSLMYGTGTSRMDHRWTYMGPDGEYEGIPTLDELDALEARVAALEQLCQAGP